MDEFKRRVAAEDLAPGTNQPLNANSYAIERTRVVPPRALTVGERLRGVRPPREIRTEIIELGPLLKYEFTPGNENRYIGVASNVTYSFKDDITISKIGNGPQSWSVALPARGQPGGRDMFLLDRIRITPLSRPRSMTEDPGLPEGGSRLHKKARRTHRNRRNLKHRKLRKLATRRR